MSKQRNRTYFLWESNQSSQPVPPRQPGIPYLRRLGRSVRILRNDEGYLSAVIKRFLCKKRLEMTPAGDVIESIWSGRRKVGLGIAFTALLAACGTTTTFYFAATSLANFVYTDKLPTDYLAEFASGQECNFLKSQKDGGPLCRDSFERVVYERPLYCYRTLGEIACYEKQDPYGRNTTRVR